MRCMQAKLGWGWKVCLGSHGFPGILRDIGYVWGEAQVYAQ
jgi:hypothetical protein